MTTVNWGLLQKSAVDDETIEEAIDRLIQAHDDDETAHLGTGQSLQSHKASEIIDHIAESVVSDKIALGAVDFRKLASDKFFVLSTFGDPDIWNEKIGTFSWSTVGVHMATSAVINDIAYIAGQLPGTVYPMVKAKNPFFQTTVRFFNTTNQTVRIKIGTLDDADYDDGFGFVVSDNQLFATHWKTSGGSPSTYGTEITGITLTVPHVYRAFFSYDDQAIYFYVDGVLKVTHTTNLPLDPLMDWFILYHLTTDENASKSMDIIDLLFQRDR